MNLGFTKKGKYVVALIKAVRTVTTIPVGGRIYVAGYEPATYLGPRRSRMESRCTGSGCQMEPSLNSNPTDSPMRSRSPTSRR